MLKPLLASSTGQILSIFLAISTYILGPIMQNKDEKIDFFLLISVAYIVIFIGSVLFMMIFGVEKRRRRVPMWLFAITGLFDFLGGILIAKAFSLLPLYTAVLIVQMIYPMTILTEYFAFNNKRINYRNITVFVILALATFFANIFIGKVLDFEKPTTGNQIQTRSFLNYAQGIGLALLCDVFFMTNTIIQGHLILPYYDASPFLIRFSLFGIVFGFLITFTVNFNNLQLSQIFSIYANNWHRLISYGLVLGIFYVAASPFINKFGPNSFNGSIITQSAYLGLFALLKDFNKVMQTENKMIMYWGCVLAILLCIISSVVLVWIESKSVRGVEENEVVNGEIKE